MTDYNKLSKSLTNISIKIGATSENSCNKQKIFAMSGKYLQRAKNSCNKRLFNAMTLRVATIKRIKKGVTHGTNLLSPGFISFFTTVHCLLSGPFLELYNMNGLNSSLIWMTTILHSAKYRVMGTVS